MSSKPYKYLFIVKV